METYGRDLTSWPGYICPLKGIKRTCISNPKHNGYIELNV
jgi:hypothetical protein